MNIQLIIVILLFMGAVFYMGRLVYRSLKSKKGCASACGKCSVDFSKVETKKN
ncbi:MAG TPA: FeoB-associated Cys-rich membrane protein [Pelobium sp.]|nr:FeoB-associated Cys-rich membrane protein [Pelobium sp.]